MTDNKTLGNLGETRLIEIISDIILNISGKTLIRDDSFFFDLPLNEKGDKSIVFNSDMFVSTTDAPQQMNHYQMGNKAVIMNISDLIVKGVEPEGVIISLGLPKAMILKEFKDLIRGIVNCSIKFNLNYIGGDLGETQEIIINPTVFGFQKKDKIIHRKGIEVGDILFSNGKFGCTGVGFDILLNQKGNLIDYPSYRKSIMSILEPDIQGNESFILSENSLVSASIDSSDGLIRSLHELMISNPGIGFEIEYDEDFIEEEALKYSKEFNYPLYKLIFNAGEEFIHLFTIPQDKYQSFLDLIENDEMRLFKLGKVIPEEKIYLLESDKRIKIDNTGFEHFK